MKKWTIILITLLFVLASCAPRENHSKVLRIGYLPITHAANLMMTEQVNQHNKQSPYKIELVQFNNWPDLMDALNSGRIDGASTLIELAMKAKSKGSPIKAVALGHHEGNVVLGQKGHRMSDFHNSEDYSFAIPHRYSTHYLLLETMREQLHIDEGHFHYHEMAPAEMPASLNEHRISGYSVAEPFGALGQKLGAGDLLQHGGDIIDDAYCCVLVLQEDVIDDASDIAQQFVSDYKEAGFLMTDTDKSVDLMAQKYKQDRDVLEQSAKWTAYGDLTLKQSGYQKIASLVEQHDLFDAPSYKSFVDTSLYKEG
ncbi:ABC transporter substrate-binding protein [Staphylococcus felis]|uniref:ABC transporter substrate-binding protein n=2 Tax=Staphylococcus felis TaxID=46127 RepID=A0ABS0QMQ8_9STAP|nr:ABC transporter substrate-binding protein [Staphylococcus felis]MBH9580516.1 ABC transporter substrate-binding protein [Staphylococcus felis]MDM8327535.1 ABC transporter substrate-binding protein [Staphylococcus felis]